MAQTKRPSGSTDSNPRAAPSRDAAAPAAGSAIAGRRAVATRNTEYRRRRTELVGQAADLFHRQGWTETSLADIARHAGLDRASLYYYFASKEEILSEMLRKALTEQAAQERLIIKAQLAPDERLRRLILIAMQGFDRHYPFLYIYVREDFDAMPISPELKQWIVRNSNRSIRIWRDTIAEGVEQGLFEIDLPVGIVAATLLGALCWTYRWYKPDRTMGPEAIANGLARLLVGGLRPLGRSESD